MNVLSLFDGMSCGQIALRELGIPIDNYFASEVDKFAIAQTQLNFPDTVQLGDVCNVHAKDLPKIDLLIGGSPCQGFSFAGKQLNFDDPRSVLFFEYVRILKELREINPEVKFLLENVRMKKEYEAVISEQLGVQPVMINSALVSAQNRVRLYWSNIRTRAEGLFGEVYTDIPQPEDRGILIEDILEREVDKKYFLSEKFKKWLYMKSDKRNTPIYFANEHEKSRCLSASDLKMNLQTNYIMQLPRGYNKGGTFIEKSPTISSSSWQNNNFVCTPAVLTPRRTEYGKYIRKEYEAGNIQEKRGNMVQLEPRCDGKSNTITTVQKDNLVIQLNPSTESQGRQPYQQNRVYSSRGKSPSLMNGEGQRTINVYCGDIRRLTPTSAPDCRRSPSGINGVVAKPSSTRCWVTAGQ